MPRRLLAPIAAVLLLAPTLALAHPGHHEDLSLLEDVRHLVTEPDHLLAAGALLIALLVGGGRQVLARARARARR